MKNMSAADEMWQNFVQSHNLPEEVKYGGDLNFDSKSFDNNAKIAMVLSGAKTAFFASLSSYRIDGEEVPVSGEYYILFNLNQEPVCIIELLEVKILPFSDVTLEMIQEEGEDSSIQEWRQKEKELLETESEIVGFNFSEKIPLVFCKFQVVFKK